MEKDKILEKMLFNFFGSTLQQEVNEVIKTDNSYRIEIPVPGLKKEDIDVKINNKLLIINSIQENKFLDKINRKYILPDYINFDEIKANIELGILTVDLPFKLNKIKEKKIEIM